MITFFLGLAVGALLTQPLWVVLLEISDSIWLARQARKHLQEMEAQERFAIDRCAKKETEGRNP